MSNRTSTIIPSTGVRSRPHLEGVVNGLPRPLAISSLLASNYYIQFSKSYGTVSLSERLIYRIAVVVPSRLKA